MIITNYSLLAIVFGIATALILFVIAGIWACFETIQHFTKEDDKFEYRVEDVDAYGIQVWQRLGEQGWELISVNYGKAYFIRRIKEEKEQ